MTQEEKAKAYDEALKKIKVLQEDWKSTHNRAWKEIEEVFPQLAESEDERIRKKLIEIVGLYYGTSAIDPERDEVLAWLEKQKEQKPVEIEVYEVGKGTTIYGQDYKCKKDYKEGNCWFIKDVTYHCHMDGYLTDQNGISWCCTPKWFKEYIQSNTEWAEEEKTRFVSGQFLQCKLSFDEFKEGEHYWLEYVGDDTYVGRSDNILNLKFHITPRQLYTLFSQQIEEKQKEQKPWEWSEEETKVLDSIIDDYEKAAKSFCGYDGKIGLLRAIRDGEYDLPKQEQHLTATVNGETIPTENQSVDIPLAEWSEDIIQKAVKEVGLTQHQIDWFKTNVFPPKQKWSVEDKQWLSEVYFAIDHSMYSEVERQAMKEYIDYLRYQSQSKQEWSEEDERNRDRALFYVRYYQKNNGDTDGSKECADWLKALSLNLKKKNEDVAKLCSNEWSDEDIEKNLIAYLRYERKSTPQEIEEKFIPYIKRVKIVEQESVSPMSYGSLDEAMQESGRRFDLPCTDKDKYSVADVFYAGVRAERESKQEWSEEDRRIMDGIQLVLESWDRTHSSIAGLPSLIPSYISWLKARRPQSKQKRQIKEGDKVSIHCRKDRKEGIITIYDGKVGEVIHVWDAKRNPWGHIGVRLDNGCNHGFYEDELEVLDELSWKPNEEQELNTCAHYSDGYGCDISPMKKCESCEHRPHWKPNEEQMEALKYAINKWEKGEGVACPSSFKYHSITELYEQLKNLM